MLLLCWAVEVGAVCECKNIQWVSDLQRVFVVADLDTNKAEAYDLTEAK